MRKSWMMMLAVGLVGGGPAFLTAQQQKASPLSAEIIASWEMAGAEFGWMTLDSSTIFTFGGAGEEGELPAFDFAERKPGALGRLPQPDREFGLLTSAAGLKDLAGLKLLRILSLGNSGVTDDRLKELTGLKSLRTLSLGYKSLRSLYLSNTQVTDAGVAELQKALPALSIKR